MVGGYNTTTTGFFGSGKLTTVKCSLLTSFLSITEESPEIM